MGVSEDLSDLVVSTDPTKPDVWGAKLKAHIQSIIAQANGAYIAGASTPTAPTATVGVPWTSNAAQYGTVSQFAQDRAATLSPSLGWEGNAIQETNIYYDSVMGKWCACYTGSVSSQAQGFATANSPYGPWTKDASPYLGQGNGGEAGAIGHTNVYVEGSTVYQFYPTATGNPGGPLKCVSWPLGQHPAGNMTAPVTVFTPSGAASNGVANSSILKDGSTYILAFEYWAQNTGTNGTWNIGYATSASLLSGYTQQAAPISGLQRATAAMFGGPRLFKENGVYTLIYHAAEQPSNVPPAILPTDVFRATATSMAGTWTQDAAPLIQRTVAVTEGDQVADVRLITDPANGQRYCSFTQFDNGTGHADTALTEFLPALLTHNGTKFVKLASPPPAPHRATLPWGYGSSQFTPSSDYDFTATSTTFAEAYTLTTGGSANWTRVTFATPRTKYVKITASFGASVDSATVLSACLFWNGSMLSGTKRRLLFNQSSSQQVGMTVSWVVSFPNPGAQQVCGLGLARESGTGLAQIHAGPTFGYLYMTAEPAANF